MPNLLLALLITLWSPGAMDAQHPSVAPAESGHLASGVAAPDTLPHRALPTDSTHAAARAVFADRAHVEVRGDSNAVPHAAVADSAGPAASRVDYLWVLRTSLLTPGSIDRVVERAREMKVRGLLVQAVGRGDAWYGSELLPRPEALRDPHLDPLGYLTAHAHAAGLEVHAWVNCCLVWSGPRRPRDSRHVVNAHPEWIARLADGRSMLRLSERQRRRLGVEGVFLNPAHPGVRTWIARVVKEIVQHYPVDGVQLDYIREPLASVGSDQESRAQFALRTGIDPARRAWLPRRQRAAMDSAWAEFQRQMVSAIVREVRDSMQATRPGLPLSAAVFADSSTAERRIAQPWIEWVRQGLLDRAFVMCYAPGVQTVLDQLVTLAEALGAGARVVPGIAVYNSSAAMAAAKIKGARALGYPVVALYSYDSLFERPDRWPSLRAFLDPSAGLTKDKP